MQAAESTSAAYCNLTKRGLCAAGLSGIIVTNFLILYPGEDAYDGEKKRQLYR